MRPAAIQPVLELSEPRFALVRSSVKAPEDRDIDEPVNKGSNPCSAPEIAHSPWRRPQFQIGVSTAFSDRRCHYLSPPLENTKRNSAKNRMNTPRSISSWFGIIAGATATLKTGSLWTQLVVGTS